jgi:endonuclease/exonuclease/phosphatase (EEP) superfamily protein YafD
LLGRFSWVLDVANEFRLQYVVAAAVLLLGAALVRQKRLALIGVLVLAFHGLSVMGPLLVPRAEAAAGPGTPFRLTTLNVYYLNRDTQPTLDYVARVQPDVAVFEETLRHWPAALEPLRQTMPYVASVTPDVSYYKGMMLFSRWPIVDVSYERPARRYLPVMIARIAVRDRIVTVIAAHPPHPTSPFYARTRRLYMDAIAAAARRAKGPVIVAGDFNATPWSQPYRALVDDAALTDAAARRPWLTTWPVWFPGPGLQIDHVLVNREVQVRRLERGPAVGSDHYPLTADLTIRRP